jgi:ADP-ribose pyrophosphatase
MADEIDAQDVFDQVESYPVRSTRQQFSGRVIDVRTDVVEMPDGITAERDIVVHPGAVGVVVLDAGERVLLVHQYRHGPRRKLWEPPAGLLDAEAVGQTAVENAQRELFEEAGYRAEDWRVLVDVFTSPGMSDEAVRVYLARGVTAVDDDERHAGEHEEADMPYAWVPLDLAVTKVLAGEISNPLAVSGILATAAAKVRGFEVLRPADAVWPARPQPVTDRPEPATQGGATQEGAEDAADSEGQDAPAAAEGSTGQVREPGSGPDQPDVGSEPEPEAAADA